MTDVQPAPRQDRQWVKWGAPGKALRMRPLGGGATVSHERADVDDRGEARPGVLRLRALTTGGNLVEQVRNLKYRKDLWVPVVTVDDEPVAVGFGVLSVPLGPGTHVVAVQTQDSKDDCVSAMLVDGADGANLVYVAPHLPNGAGLDDVSQHGRLGRPGVAPEHWPDYRYMQWAHAAAFASLLTALAIGAVGAVVANSSAGSPALVAVIAAIVVVPSVLAGFQVGRRVKRKRARNVAEAAAESAAALAVAPIRAATHGTPAWHCAGTVDGLTPERPGHGLVIVRQELRQWPEPVPQDAMFKPLPHAEAATHAPRVHIGQHTLPQGWGTWAVEVPAGRHLAGAGLDGAEGAAAIDVTAGGRAEITVSVRTEHRWDGTGPDATREASVPQVSVTAR